MQKSYANFLHENFAKGRDTLKTVNFVNHTKLFQHENILHEIFLEQKANYNILF